MVINTFVELKGLPFLGIGCVSKVLKKTVRVNFGTDDCIILDPKQLVLVDVSKTETITFQEFQTMSMANAVRTPALIIGNEVKEWVGIGWISKRIVTKQDLLKLKRVI